MTCALPATGRGLGERRLPGGRRFTSSEIACQLDLDVCPRRRHQSPAGILRITARARD